MIEFKFLAFIKCVKSNVFILWLTNFMKIQSKLNNFWTFGNPYLKLNYFWNQHKI